MIHSTEDQPDAETEHFTKMNILRPFFSIIVEQIDKIDSQLQKSIKIDNHKKASDRFLSIFNINRLFSIDYDRLPSIFIEYRKYRLGTSCIVWFQKISIPPPRKVTGNSEGEGGSKAEFSEGSGGFIGRSFSRG